MKKRGRLRRLVVSRLLRGDLRRWAMYLALTSIWNRYRKLSGKQPELVYRAVLGRGARVDMATSKPLPRRLRTKRVQRALEAAARADLAAASAGRS